MNNPALTSSSSHYGDSARNLRQTRSPAAPETSPSRERTRAHPPGFFTKEKTNASAPKRELDAAQSHPKPPQGHLKATTEPYTLEYRATPRLPQGHPKATPRLPQGHPKATPRPPQGHPKATSRLPQGYLKATPRLPQGYPKATSRLPQGHPHATPKPSQSHLKAS